MPPTAVRYVRAAALNKNFCGAFYKKATARARRRNGVFFGTFFCTFLVKRKYIYVKCNYRNFIRCKS